MDEFELIRRFFLRAGTAPGVPVGIGPFRFEIARFGKVHREDFLVGSYIPDLYGPILGANGQSSPIR